jgi:hypothetical protein
MASPLAMSGMRPQRRSAARGGAYAQVREDGDDDDLSEVEEEAPRQRGRRAGKGKLLATVLLPLRGGARTLYKRSRTQRVVQPATPPDPARPARALHFAAAAAAAAAATFCCLSAAPVEAEEDEEDYQPGGSDEDAAGAGQPQQRRVSRGGRVTGGRQTQGGCGWIGRRVGRLHAGFGPRVCMCSTAA